ncbi:glutathione S-transferase family protein [Kaistia dalseonensis]|uniref:Glutathione S-transferase n=1 Tax=Kaistia dalseonensis TaxID=410840 RepID=A0ABU0H604_9HYPH|nr:glutathione S-transferase family protein [Kaistia dalseonensis]MCX5495133.1 glutathione S-transferase family protein [Kaistia dalseonensis]MDQ0437715.1 glutathione S-transferase [Kaistia dalseonensis]
MAAIHTLYSMQFSGNCYKPRLAMHELGIPFEIVDFRKGSGQTTSPDFLALNPNAQVPLLILPDGRPLSESNAMLLHLAEGSDLIPVDRYERALCYQWLFFEQYSHEPVIAVARNWLHYIPGGRETMAHRIEEWREKGNRVLSIMEDRLKASDFFAGPSFSIADIALYAYTHVAGEADYDLARYPAVSAWLARVAARPRHVGLDWRP